MSDRLYVLGRFRNYTYFHRAVLLSIRLKNSYRRNDVFKMVDLRSLLLLQIETLRQMKRFAYTRKKIDKIMQMEDLRTFSKERKHLCKRV